jgi:hypothetical protein
VSHHRFATGLTGDRLDATVFLGADFLAGLTSGVAMPVFTASLPRAVPIAVAAVFRNGSSAFKTFLVRRISFPLALRRDVLGNDSETSALGFIMAGSFEQGVV